MGMTMTVETKQTEWQDRGNVSTIRSSIETNKNKNEYDAKLLRAKINKIYQYDEYQINLNVDLS